MLRCPDRERRLAFDMSDTVAADVLEITPDNFRQRLPQAGEIGAAARVLALEPDGKIVLAGSKGA